MIYCSKCGNQLEDDMNFCNKCGTKVREFEMNRTLNGDEPNQQNEKKDIIDRSVEEVSTTNALGNITGVLIFINIFIGGCLLFTTIEATTFFFIMLASICISILIRTKQKSNNAEKVNHLKNKKKEVIQQLEINGFNSNYIMLTVDGKGILIDESNKKIAISKEYNQEPIIFDFKELLSYEMIEDGSQEIEGKAFETYAAGRLFGANAALATANGTKNIVQFCTDLRIIIHTKEIQNENPQIVLVNARLNKNSEWYKNLYNFGKELVVTLDKVINANKEEKQEIIEDIEKRQSINYSTADEIKKYKELLDMGAITQEEFDNKKKELLSQ